MAERISSQPSRNISAALTIDLISSIRLSIENMRLTPSTGFMLSSLGLTFSKLSTGPACRKSVSSPTAATGTSSIATSISDSSAACAPMERAAPAKPVAIQPWPMVVSRLSISPARR